MLINYEKGKKGTNKLFKSIKRVISMFYEEDCISEDWKDDLEEYNMK